MAKVVTNTNRMLSVIRSAFHHIKHEYFNDELPEVELTLQKTRGAYGHFSVGKIWDSNGECRHEININPEYTRRPIEEVVTTLIHECVHLYAETKGIKDTSNNGVYHNKKFKDLAERLGHIKIEQAPIIGFSVSSPTEETINFCIRHGLEDMQCSYGFTFPVFGGVAVGGTTGNGGAVPTTSPKPSSTRRWVCPSCGTIIRSTKEVHVICADCGELFKESNK